MDINQSNNFFVKQRGATLIVALVMLLVITMIALTSMQSTALQQHMSGNMKDHEIAFQSAEIGLRVAEQWLESRNMPPQSYTYNDCLAQTTCRVFATGAVANNPVDSDLAKLTTVQDWLNKSLDITAFDGALIAGVSEQPRITVELVESQTDGIGSGGGYGAVSGIRRRDLYRLTVRSTGGSGRAEVILQSHYAARYY